MYYLAEAYYVSRTALNAGDALHAVHGLPLRLPLELMRITLQKDLHVLEGLLLHQYFQRYGPSGNESQRTVAQGCADINKYLVECIYEDIRSQEYPEQPSRLDALFLFQDIKHARDYLRAGLGGNGYIYRCIGACESCFIGDFKLVSKGIDLEDLRGDMRFAVERLTRRARKYWSQATEPQVPELLIIEPKVRIADTVR